MASPTYRVGDLVWAKMKGFPAWPGKIIQPKAEVKRPSSKKPQYFVFFFGSENYAWIPAEHIWNYVDHRSKMLISKRIPRGYREAVEAMDDAVKALPTDVTMKTSDLPSIDEELAQIFPNKSSTPHRDYSREPLTGKSKKKTPQPAHKVTSENEASKKSRRVSKGSLEKVIKVLKSRSTESKTTTTTTTSSQRSSKRFASPPSHPTSAKKPKQITKIASPLPPQKKAAEPVRTTETKENEQQKDISEDRTLTNSVSTEPAPPVKNVIATPLKIGFLGLGLMGQGMVANLLKSGHEVTVWNRTASKCRDLVKAGAIKGNTPAEVVSSCDMTFSSVADPTAVKDLVFGNCGVLQGIQPGKGYVDMSTVDVETVTDVNEAICARGGRFLEAPVGGSKDSAEAGNLLIMASGDRSLYEDSYSCFEAMGKKSFFLGEIGNGSRMKLVLNMLTGTIIASLAEALALAEKVGLDQDEVLQAVELTSVHSQLLKSQGHAILTSKFEPHFPLQHQQKDLRLAIAMADQVDQPLHVAAAANELFKKAKAKGYGENDTSAVFRAVDL